MDKGEIIRRLKKISSHAVHVVGEPPFIMSLDDGIALDEAVQLLKEQEAVEPYMDYDGHDVWRCGNCGATMFHIEHSQADEDWKSYAKFCRQCGKKVKWE